MIDSRSNDGGMLKVSDLMARLACSRSTVYMLIDTGRLGHHRCPGIRVSESQLAAYLEQTRRERDKTPARPRQTRSRLRHIRL